MSEESGALLQVKREIPKSFKGIELDIDPGKRGCDGEFDPGSGQTLAAYLRHASRTGLSASAGSLVADG